MQFKIFSLVVLLSIIYQISAEWIAQAPLNLNNINFGLGLGTCQLRDQLYASVFIDTDNNLINHFTWNENGTISAFKTFENTILGVCYAFKMISISCLHTDLILVMIT